MAVAATIQPQTQDVNITISLSDISVLNDIKKALKLFKGVEKVKTSTSKSHGAKLSDIQKSIRDAREGRVTRWESVDQMFDTLMKD